MACLVDLFILAANDATARFFVAVRLFPVVDLSPPTPALPTLLVLTVLEGILLKLPAPPAAAAPLLGTVLLKLSRRGVFGNGRPIDCAANAC